ncbi:MAG: hypothetical protein GEV11_27160, partial [Streptosporangiales bacterium]|nr:hypothetical protein [Streptosporangiales bacterium]
MAHDPESRHPYSRTIAPDPLGPSEFGTEGDVPLETLLAEPLLRGTTVVGSPGLRHRVSWCLPLSEVESAGVPTVTGGAGPGPDLAGVAVHVPATSLIAEDSPEMIRRLAQRGVAALLAWPAPECPADLDLSRAGAAAEAAGLPLLRLQGTADYRAVSRLIGQKALAQTSHVLEYGVKVHRVLAEVLARGSGIPAMAAAIGGLAHCPVLVLDDEDEVIAHAFPGGRAPAGPEHLAELVTRAAGPVRGGTGELRPGETTEHVLDLDGRPLHATVAAIVVGGELYGRLALVQNEWPPDAHDLAQHRVIAEHGGTLTGSEMLRQRSVQAAEERARGDFIQALVHGRFADAHELQARARHHGFAVQGRYGVHIVAAQGLLPASR